MIFFPIVMNSIQFWIQDNILKGKKENTIKFINSPYHERTHTKKIPQKLQANETEFLRPLPKDQDEKQSMSEYHA